MPDMKIKYEQHGLGPQNARVWLNDMEITRSLIGFKITVEPDQLPCAEIRVRPDAIEIDAETLAMLQAVVKNQGDNDQG